MALELTVPEIDTLIMHRAAFLFDHGAPIQTADPIMDKLSAERARLVEIAERKAKNDARMAQEAVNIRYAEQDMQEGDVVEFTYYTTMGYGRSATHKEVTRRMRIISSDDARSPGCLNLNGVILTKSGKPHATLNNHGYSGSGHRSEYGVPKRSIFLIEKAPKPEPRSLPCTGGDECREV